MISVSFLGTGDYKETIYSYKNEKFTTCYFPVAVKSFFEDKITKSFIILTEDAKKTHGGKISKEMNFEEILIPFGKTEEEIWQIFSNIVDKINENEEIVFDITHGFRAQPLVAIACLMYLRNQKNIKIKNILYGAYEARDTATGIAPVFDLKPFVDIIDWSNAIYEFTHNGNLKSFKTLLSELSNSNNSMLPGHRELFNQAGDDLLNLTNSFLTFRLREIVTDFTKFLLKKNELQEISDKNVNIKPFGLIINKIISDFAFLGIDEKEFFKPRGLKAQKEMIGWYLKTEQYQKAITLAREYIVSKCIILKGNMEKCTNQEYRNQIADYLNRKSKTNLKECNENYFTIWHKVTELRNDMSHAGIPKYFSSKTSMEIINAINIICRDLINKL